MWRKLRRSLRQNRLNLLLDHPDAPTLIYIGQLFDNSFKPTNLSLVNLLKLTYLKTNLPPTNLSLKLTQLKFMIQSGVVMMTM